MVEHPRWTIPPPPDEAPLVEWALWYSTQGWTVFPCHGKVPITRRGFLDATRDEDQIRSWWNQWPGANIGIPIPAGQVVLDIDPRSGGDTTLHELESRYGPLPDTLTSHTGGGGLHLFHVTSVRVKNKARLGDGIDVQAVGSYVIAPPSVHPDTGIIYRWDIAYGPETLEPQPLPEWLETLVTITAAPQASPRDPQAPIPEGQREKTLMALAGAMQRQGASQDAIRSALEAENARCVPPLDGADLDRMTRSVGRYTPAPRLDVASNNGAATNTGTQDKHDQQALPLSDYFNALALVERYGGDMHYCYPWKSWLVWTGTHWRRDEAGSLIEWATATMRALFDTLKDLPENARDALYRHIKTSLNTGRLKAMVERAQSLPGIPVMPDQFDQQIWLLNCTSGTLDLRTGLLTTHRRDDLLTKCLPMAYDPDATCPTWERFVWRAMGGSLGPDDPDASGATHQSRYEADERARRLIGFLQRAVGYSLTGSTREQCLFLLHGVTKTGKSTCVSTLRSLLGAYGKQAEMSTFLQKDRPEIRNDLADLAGSRLVVASESDKGKRLAENLIKQLTGGVDVLKARFLFQDLFEFAPQFKLFVATNHLPVIHDTDDSIWERIHCIPFDVFIPPEEREKTLDETLRRELPGILAWAVQGCLEWQRYGDLRPPQEVRYATREYRKEMDTLGQFIQECCLVHPDLSVKVGDLVTAYQRWCTEQGHQAGSLYEIGKRLDAMGYRKEEKRRTKGWFRKGIGLFKASDDEEQDE